MGRRASPWWRSTPGEWYVTLNGVKTRLHITDRNDEAGAWAAFQALLKAAQAAPACRPEPIAVLVSEYLSDRSHAICEKTRRGYASCLRWLAARFGERCAADLSPTDVEKGAAKEDWSDSHRANVLWAVQALIRWAGRKDFALNRPAKESRGADAVISEAVYGAILRDSRGDFYQLMRLLWEVGSRPMESGLLTAEAIDWAAGTITLRQHKTKKKTGRVRVIYLTAGALTILQEQKDKYQAGPLFRGIHGQPLTLAAVMKRMIYMSKRIGHHVTAGMFRHTFATRALAAGVPDTHVAALLGHTSTAMIHKHYAHVNANAKLLREAAEKVSRAAG